VASVRGALERLPGVQVEEVRIGSATVAFDEARAKPEAIRQAVEDAGYDVVTTSGR
jgi:copper chaperone CopZ